jgi:phage terminase small subunit
MVSQVTPRLHKYEYLVGRLPVPTLLAGLGSAGGHPQGKYCRKCRKRLESSSRSVKAPSQKAAQAKSCFRRVAFLLGNDPDKHRALLRALKVSQGPY